MTYDEQIINFIFEDDEGMLLDIYVLHTTTDDWQQVLDALRDSSYEFTFTDGQSSIPVPGRATDIFPADETKSLARFLQVQVDGVQIRCNFFIVDEIEFDLDPIQVTGMEQAKLVIQFMQLLNRATGKEVILTPESYQANVLIRVAGDTIELSRGLHG